MAMCKHIIAILCLGCLAACNLEVDNLNGPNLETLVDNPTPSAIAAASTGMLITLRTGLADRPGYVSELGILGRESYVLDPADPRFITELMKTQEIGPGSLVFGGNFWATPYAGIHNAEIILTAVDNVGSAMTDEEKEATRGFVKTMEALQYLVVYNTRFDVGGVIVMSDDPNVLDPIVGKAEMENKIQSLLEEAKTHLMAGGDVFPFPLSSGFTGFDTPTNFVKVNRAIKARMSVYVGSHAQALTELQESFIAQDMANPQFNLGAFNVFRSAGGDLTNQLVDPNIYANPSIFATAHKDAGGMVDDQRVLAKLEKLPTPVGQSGLTATETFKMYTITTPIAIIRNEELILLKAEAEIFTNDLATANTDLNFVRTLSGGLPPYPAFASQAEAIDALVYERRNSLLFEGGHRWIDSRRLGKLGDLPLDGGFVHMQMPIPQAETDAR
jgi:starch-binding outer membrane protein, SusD/RagB family